MGLMLAGCASELATSARVDELGVFRRKLQSAAKNNEPEVIDQNTLRDVAEVVASRELVTAKGRDAEARVVELAACAPALEEPLESVSEAEGAASALAIQVLLDGRVWDGDPEELVRRYSADPRDDWRAVGLRAAVSPEHAATRAKGFLDADLRVRRAALKAAFDAKSARDLPGLFEAARLDPDRTCRALALGAIGAIGDADVLRRLRELWPSQDERDRGELASVWSRDVAFRAGGEQQLEWVLGSQHGIPQLIAAIALVSRGPERVRDWASQVLVTAIDSGTNDETRYAAAHAPRTKQVNEALSRLARSKDETRAVWGAIASLRPGDAQALSRMRVYADSKVPAVSEAARYALAAVGDEPARSQLKSQLNHAEPEQRFEAAVVLLGDGSDVASVRQVAGVLADPSASVRTRFACWVLRDERPGFDHFHSHVRP